MTTETRAEANRQNALRSTGPKTQSGIEAARFNAVRHGLRSLQTVVPGEAPEEWEAHRAAVVDDLKPLGAVELALAEQVAAKLWRLGRVVRHEADIIAIGQARDEILYLHDKSNPRPTRFFPHVHRTGIPNSEDVTSARQAVSKAEERTVAREVGLRVLSNLGQSRDEDRIPHEDWPVWDALKQDLELGDLADKVFVGEEDFEVRHIRMTLKMKGKEEEIRQSLMAHWRDEKIPELRKQVVKAKRALKGVLRRYEAALERLRLSRGLPDGVALEKIQRYEAHLERGLHRALGRLQALQEARGAVPSSRKPSVTVAVVQAAPEAAGMASFGSFAIEGQATPR
jgi:hypothetical protein